MVSLQILQYEYLLSLVVTYHYLPKSHDISSLCNGLLKKNIEIKFMWLLFAIVLKKEDSY